MYWSNNNHYAAVQINNYLKRTFAIKVATMTIFIMNGSHHVPAYHKIVTLFTVSKDE